MIHQFVNLDALRSFVLANKVFDFIGDPDVDMYSIPPPPPGIGYLAFDTEADFHAFWDGTRDVQLTLF